MAQARLTDAKVKRARCPTGKKRIKLADGHGLHLLVTAAGGKYWRWDYAWHGKRKTLALGVYPLVSLKRARDLHHKGRDKLAGGINPANNKAKVTFEDIARQWMARQQDKWGDKHKAKMLRWFDHDILPVLGERAPDRVTPADVLELLRQIESAGNIEKLHKVKAAIQRVFAAAIAEGKAQRNPAAEISSKDALTPLTVKHRAAITTPKEAGDLMRAIAEYPGDIIVKCGLRMLAYVFTRPGELRLAEWAEFDIANALWRIPDKRMKMRRPHLVPLARQVVEILRDLEPITGGGQLVFHSLYAKGRPISENTLNQALRRMGYGKDEMCSHGFRGMASTLLHEQGWPTDVIERQLAHKETNAVKGAYDHAEHLPKRIEMMQSWATYLDGLRDGADVIPIHG